MVKFVFLEMARQHVQWVGNEDSAFVARPVKGEKSKVVYWNSDSSYHFANEYAKKIFTFRFIKPFFFHFKRKRCVTNIL